MENNKIKLKRTGYILFKSKFPKNENSEEEWIQEIPQAFSNMKKLFSAIQGYKTLDGKKISTYEQFIRITKKGFPIQFKNVDENNIMYETFKTIIQ